MFIIRAFYSVTKAGDVSVLSLLLYVTRSVSEIDGSCMECVVVAVSSGTITSFEKVDPVVDIKYNSSVLSGKNRAEKFSTPSGANELASAILLLSIDGVASDKPSVAI